ncbi:hypothetical protein ACFTSF_18075 [Kribbella sp. NPDC056951]|uniref:hypothetical protein n=1 Tax=Kribbella sp. NPDC056951 TaxID=3345978 RepID=UPI0036338825
MSAGLRELPEPTDLHAWASAAHGQLDWGDRIPAKAEIAAQYGEGATAESLRLLTAAARAESRITAAVLTAIGSEATPYHLANRMKSPQSLARKLVRYQDLYKRTGGQPEDVLRYTAAVEHPDDLTAAAVRTIDRLTGQQAEMEAAHHSYVDGSRYKGLHTSLRSYEQRYELQVHSAESIRVKEQTTSLYEIERDLDQPRDVRGAARRECIELSHAMTQPAGIDELTELGGIPVRAISYGKQAARAKGSQSAGQSPAKDQAQYRQPNQQRQDGITR